MKISVNIRVIFSLLAIFAVSVVTVFTAGCFGEGGELNYKDLNLSGVKKVGASRGAFRVTIDEVGLVEAGRKVRLFAPFSGKVRQVATDGSKVKEGDLLIEIDPENIYERLESSINDLKIDKADVERSIDALQNQLLNDTLDRESAEAKLEYERIRLLEVNRQLETLEILEALDVVPEQEVEDKEFQLGGTRLNVVKTDLQHQNESVTGSVNRDLKRRELQDLGRRGDRSLRRVKEWNDQLEQSMIRAPEAGTWFVLKDWEWTSRREVPLAPGSEVRGGRFVGEVALSGALLVRSQVSEALIAYVDVGTPAAMIATALDNRELRGEVVKIGNAAMEREQSAAGRQSSLDDPSGLKVFEIEIALDEAPEELKPGMTVDVSILRKELNDVVSVPFEAIFRRDGLPVVYIATPTGPERREVILGEKSKERILVREGLDGTESLFTADLDERLEELKASSGKNSTAGGGGDTL